MFANANGAYAGMTARPGKDSSDVRFV